LTPGIHTEARSKEDRMSSRLTQPFHLIERRRNTPLAEQGFRITTLFYLMAI
jgi:hypothetical protein